VIKMRRAQRTFGDGLIENEVKGLSEEWMIHADRVLEDEQLIAIVFEELGKRHPKSKSRGGAWARRPHSSHGSILLLGRAERSIPNARQGRASWREGLTAKVRAKRQSV
jgi:hypothetical protein